jgi:RNA polymerase sigma-70 factor (ECF subfamily)
MPPSAPAPIAEALLAHADWIRTLARSLVRDPDTAEEVAQRALVAAWSSPPGEHGSLRGWLARCIRNFAHDARRASERRGRNEALAARQEALPSAHDVVERASLSRELVEHVLALEEPYRTAILLRYFDEKEPGEIGRELGLPAATVRTHVARGLARLRERLDRRHGGREAWGALFLPLVAHGAAAPSLSTLILMNTSLKIVLPAALGLLAIAYFGLRPEKSPPRAAAASVAEPASEDPGAAADPGPSVALAAEPERAPRSAATAVATEPKEAAIAPERTAPASTGARGRVLDVDGQPAAGVRLATSLRGDGAATMNGPGALDVRSAADGTFTIPGPLPACSIRANDPALATVLAGVHGDGSDEGEIVVVVARALSGEGSVVDAAGAPLEDVRVHVDLPADLRARFSVPLDRSAASPCEATTDASGRFTLPGVPRVPDAKLVAELDGYQTWSSRLDEIQGMPIVITLLKPGVTASAIAGRVVDAAKQPVEGAHVAFGIETARTEADGSFRFALDNPNGLNARLGSAATDLRAASPGFLPAVYEPPLEGGKPSWPAFVELELGVPTLAIEGKVVDHEGRARAGLMVWLADSTTFGLVGDGVVQLESLLAGSPRGSWRVIETSDGGHFRIEGLLDRPYTLEAMEPETLLRTRETDVPAGTTGVVLRMEEDALYPRVAGVVRGHDGRGIAGAAIGPMCDAFRSRWGDTTLGTSHSAVEGVRTDAEGRFELENVPRSLVYLRIDGEGILPLEYGRWVEGDPRFEHVEVRELPVDRIESLEIVVDRRAHLQVELGDPSAADEFALVDEDGTEIEISTFTGSGRREGMRAPIRGGRSDVVAGTDRARSIVLFQGGLEVARLPVTLVPGETTPVYF